MQEDDAMVDQLLNLRAHKSMSGLNTRDSSVKDEVTNWSFFEKIERLKERIVETHMEVKSLQNPQIDELLSEAKSSNKNKFLMQPAHPHWIKEQKEA